MNLPSVSLVLLVSASACATVPRRIDAARANVVVTLSGATDLEPEVHPDCVRALHSALARHGFTPGAEGTRFEVRATFFDQLPLAPGESTRSTVDFVGLWRDRPDPAPVAVSATGTDAMETGSLLRPAARARIAACVYGADRLVDELIDQLSAPPSSAR